MRAPFPSHPLTPYPPLIINAALTGGVIGRERAPRLPLTTDEIIQDAVRAADAGASIVHLHVRDGSGAPDWRRESYEPVIYGIRESRPEVIVCVTTTGRAGISREQRADVLSLDGDLRPDMASLTLGSLNFHTGVSVNDVATVEYLASAMLGSGVVPELEIFDLGMAALANRLVAREILPALNYANVILGSLNSAPADVRALSAIVDLLPDGTQWAAGGLGAFQRPVNGLSAFMGGHIRTGLEDNPDLEPGSATPATNELLVRRAADLAAAASRDIATPAEARALIGLRDASGLGLGIGSRAV